MLPTIDRLDPGRPLLVLAPQLSAALGRGGDHFVDLLVAAIHVDTVSRICGAVQCGAVQCSEVWCMIMHDGSDVVRCKWLHCCCQHGLLFIFLFFFARAFFLIVVSHRLDPAHSPHVHSTHWVLHVTSHTQTHGTHWVFHITSHTHTHTSSAHGWGAQVATAMHYVAHSRTRTLTRLWHTRAGGGGHALCRALMHTPTHTPLAHTGRWWRPCTMSLTLTRPLHTRGGAGGGGHALRRVGERNHVEALYPSSFATTRPVGWSVYHTTHHPPHTTRHNRSPITKLPLATHHRPPITTTHHQPALITTHPSPITTTMSCIHHKSANSTSILRVTA
jgi:hypothetical protein